MSRTFMLTRAELVIRDKGEYTHPAIYAVLEWSNPYGSGQNLEVCGVGETRASHYAYYQGWTGCQFGLAKKRLIAGTDPPIKDYEPCPPSAAAIAAKRVLSLPWRVRWPAFWIVIGAAVCLLVR